MEKIVGGKIDVTLTTDVEEMEEESVYVGVNGEVNDSTSSGGLLDRIGLGESSLVDGIDEEEEEVVEVSDSSEKKEEEKTEEVSTGQGLLDRLGLDPIESPEFDPNYVPKPWTKDEWLHRSFKELNKKKQKGVSTCKKAGINFESYTEGKIDDSISKFRVEAEKKLTSLTVEELTPVLKSGELYIKKLYANKERLEKPEKESKVAGIFGKTMKGSKDKKGKKDGTPTTDDVKEALSELRGNINSLKELTEDIQKLERPYKDIEDKFKDVPNDTGWEYMDEVPKDTPLEKIPKSIKLHPVDWYSHKHDNIDEAVHAFLVDEGRFNLVHEND